MMLAVAVVLVAVRGAVVSGNAADGQTFKLPQGRAENVRFERAAGDIVTVFYDLASDDARAVFKVTLEVLPPNAEPRLARSVTGDVGSNIKPGSGKKIVWDAGKDVESLELDRFRFKVLAEAGPGKEIAAPSTRTAALVVSTEPPGATVLVDGAERGKAPVTLTDVPAGRHRIQVVLTGYLENSQSVDLVAGQSQRVDVKLTSLAAPAQEKHGGSPLKWILPVAGGGAAVAAVLAARSGGSPAPPAQKCTASFTVSPSGAGVAGLAAATTFLFGATGTCDNYGWTFGDGTSAQGTSASHTFNDAGQFSVILSGTNQAGTTTQSQTVIVRSMAGVWAGTIGTSPAITFTLQLQQSGGSISGTYSDSRYGAGSVTRSGVSDVRNVSLTVSQGPLTINLQCKGSDDMNSCSGTTTDAYTATLTMTRQ